MDALTSARPLSIRSLPTSAWLQRRSRSRSTRRIQFVNLVNTPRRPTPIERSVRRPGQVRNCPVAPTIGSTPKAWAEGEGTLRRPRPWLPLYQRRRRRRRPDLRRPPKRRSSLRTSPVGSWRARCQDPWGQPPPIFMRPSACRRSAKASAPTWALIAARSVAAPVTSQESPRERGLLAHTATNARHTLIVTTPPRGTCTRRRALLPPRW